jgi:hypothetical protein
MYENSRNKEEVCTSGLMAINILAIGGRTPSMALVYYIWPMEEFTSASGEII